MAQIITFGPDRDGKGGGTVQLSDEEAAKRIALAEAAGIYVDRKS